MKHAASFLLSPRRLATFPISARALQTLRDCDLIAAEDTRVTRALLNHFEIDTPCVSNHQHNEGKPRRADRRAHAGGGSGCGAGHRRGHAVYQRPGSFLAKEAAAAGIEVLAVPGPTAMASALSVSGFDTREFAFYGFLPRQKRELSESCWRLRAPACRLPSRTNRRTA